MTALPLSDEELAELHVRLSELPYATWTLMPVHLRRSLETITQRDAAIAVLVDAVSIAFNHIDAAMGDTDPQNDDDPLLLASQSLAPFVGDENNLPAAATAYIAEREADRAKIKSMEGERDDARTALYNEERRHDAAVRRANAAEANQRKPGTVEVCENHVYKECRNHGGAMRYEKCRVKPCPFNRTAEGGVT